jgi:hypothetical protein
LNDQRGAKAYSRPPPTAPPNRVEVELKDIVEKFVKNGGMFESTALSVTPQDLRSHTAANRTQA